MNAEKNKILLELAKNSIKEELEGVKLTDEKTALEKFPELKNESACFVTLRSNGNLRGCIGSIIPHRPLVEDIIQNAKSAAFRDPRFAPLGKEEFKNIDLEISILTVPEKLDYEDTKDLKSKIRPNIDGVIIRLDSYQATFLPQVWEELPSFEQFFSHLCMKAGLSGNCLENHPEIYTYQAEKIG